MSSPSRDNSAVPLPRSSSFDTASIREEALCVHFNQDHSHFAWGSDTGFKTFATDPLAPSIVRTFSSHGGIAIVEMLYRTNLIALVGGGNNPQFASNQVKIWDDHQKRVIGELSFRSNVRSVRLRRDRIVICLDYKVYVYNFADFTLVDTLETAQNQEGHCVVSYVPENLILATLDKFRGHVAVHSYHPRKSLTIEAHESSIACLALTDDGSKLATASVKGTLVRLFDTATGRAIAEFRRGLEPVMICSMTFSRVGEWLCVASVKGTVHLFSACSPTDANNTNTKSTVGSLLKNFLVPQYFTGQWSSTQFRVPAGMCKVSFGKNRNTIIVITYKGTYYHFTFDPQDPSRMGFESACKDLFID